MIELAGGNEKKYVVIPLASAFPMESANYQKDDNKYFEEELVVGMDNIRDWKLKNII